MELKRNEKHKLIGHTSYVLCVTKSQDRNFIASGSADKTPSKFEVFLTKRGNDANWAQFLCTVSSDIQ